VVDYSKLKKGSYFVHVWGDYFFVCRVTKVEKSKTSRRRNGRLVVPTQVFWWNEIAWDPKQQGKNDFTTLKSGYASILETENAYGPYATHHEVLAAIFEVIGAKHG
jgi:hypothetical protein